MITVYCDYEAVVLAEPGEHTLVMSEASDYVPIRQQVRKALDNRDPHAKLAIYLRSPVFARWMADLLEYGPHFVRWEEVRLRDKLGTRLGMSPPPGLTDQAIRDLGLLDLPLPEPGSVVDPACWVLGNTLGRVWNAASPSERHLAELADWLAKADTIPPVLAPLADSVIRAWAMIDPRYSALTQGDMREAASGILLRWALRAYPEPSALRAKVAPYPLVDCGAYAESCMRALARVREQVARFWGEWRAANRDADAEAALRLMSGLSSVELQTIQAIATAHPERVLTTLVAVAAQHFSSLPASDLEPALEKLRDLVRVEPPSEPDVNWPEQQWLQWVIREYIPYFGWVVRAGQPRDKQLELGSKFGDWLVGAYPTMLFAPESALLTNVRAKVGTRLRAATSGGGSVAVFWLIVDGLTWWQAERLGGILGRSGRRIERIQPTLSVLPSITSISKRALVQGSVDRTPDSRSIAQVMQHSTLQGGAPVHVYRQQYEMRKALNGTMPSGLHVLFYNDLDHHGHSSQSYMDAAIDGHLKLVAELVNEAFRVCATQGLDALVYVSSDHGSTLVPSTARTLNPPKFARVLDDGELEYTEAAPMTSERRTRSCLVTKLPDGLQLKRIEEDWYVLRGDLYSLPGDYIVPKGYAAVDRKPTGWTHGGATPEETVTAFMEILPEAMHVLDPSVSIEAKLLSKSTSPMSVKVTNANPFPLQRVELTIVGAQAPFTTERIEATSATSATMVALPADGKGQTQLMRWLLTFCVGGARHESTGEVEVQVRRLQSEGADIFDI